LYVKNLNFATSEASLRTHFDRVGTVRDVHIPRRYGRVQGYAFVSMSSEAEVERAIQQLNGLPLDGRPLTIERARPNVEHPDLHPLQPPDTFGAAVVLKGLAPRTTRADIAAAFPDCALKRTTMKTNPDGTSRSYAFLTFQTPADMQRALQKRGRLFIAGTPVDIEPNRNVTAETPLADSVVLRNLPADATEDDVRQQLTGYSISDFYRPVHPDGRYVDYAYVRLSSPAEQHRLLLAKSFVVIRRQRVEIVQRYKRSGNRWGPPVHR
jgi:RNA recognition motif-containing protein